MSPLKIKSTYIKLYIIIHMGSLDGDVQIVIIECMFYTSCYHGVIYRLENKYGIFFRQRIYLHKNLGNKNGYNVKYTKGV